MGWSEDACVGKRRGYLYSLVFVSFRCFFGLCLKMSVPRLIKVTLLGKREQENMSWFFCCCYPVRNYKLRGVLPDPGAGGGQEGGWHGYTEEGANSAPGRKEDGKTQSQASYR